MSVKVKPLGLLILLLAFLGLGGAAIYWQQSASQAAGLTPSTAAGGRAVGKTRGTILLVTSATKKDWLQDQIERFNETNKGQMEVKIDFIETREALQNILNGKTKPILWAPSSPLWSLRLGDAWTEKHPGDPLLDMSDSTSFRTYLRTPIVFLTTRERYEFLKPRLGGAQSWEAIRKLSTGEEKTPWGTLRYAYADPLNANSGFLTLAGLLADYAAKTGKMGDINIVASSPEFGRFLTDLGKAFVYDEPVKEGSSALHKAFIEDPTRYDFISTYESNALKAVAENPKFVIIYPNPTTVAEQSIVLLTGGDWVTPDQRAVAMRFLDYLGGKDSLRDGLKTKFRPAQSSGEVSLAEELSRYQSQGVQQTFTSVEPPPYLAINEAAIQWRKFTARDPITNSP